MVLKKPPSANQSFKCPATSPRRHKKLLQSVYASEIWKIVKIFWEEGALGSHWRYVLKINFFIELGLKMIQFKIQFKTKSGITIQKKYSFNRVQNIQ